ncbi:stress-response A/B barrel domain-containing protein UP3-like [Andrographis paniculata]|uniref:stress-response A/B barrel domain-containing protein UP3-like n=1 Tax=Andrographis paniculata TaxID=175694 RepID=UPI0021E8E877|nr:stress-response A/B barrel domain-containing protein UP3-like [Andrographis paniculata]
MMKLSTAAAALAHTHFPSTDLRRRSAALLRHKSSLRSSSTSIKMSSASDSASNPNHIVEHIVLFKVKPAADPSAVAAMVSNLNGLSSLDSVLHISAGPVFRCRSGSLAFTHVLHSRYRSKTDLTAYADHPSHVTVVANYVKPIVDDVMAVDWIAGGFAGEATVPVGSALRLTVLKLKENSGEGDKQEVMELARGIKEKLPSIAQLTVGENFSPGRAKGYSICSMAIFEDTKDVNSESDYAAAVGAAVDDALVVDFAVESPIRGANL